MTETRIISPEAWHAAMLLDDGIEKLLARHGIKPTVVPIARSGLIESMAQIVQDAIDDSEECIEQKGILSWAKVEDQPPPKGTMVLVFYRLGGKHPWVHVAYLNAINEWCWSDSDPVSENVKITHWQLLPSPPNQKD